MKTLKDIGYYIGISICRIITYLLIFIIATISIIISLCIGILALISRGTQIVVSYLSNELKYRKTIF